MGPTAERGTKIWFLSPSAQTAERINLLPKWSPVESSGAGTSMEVLPSFDQRRVGQTTRMIARYTAQSFRVCARTVVPHEWSPDRQHQHHLGTG